MAIMMTQTSTTAVGHDIPVTSILAKFIANAESSLVTEQIAARLRTYILDYFGVTIAAAFDCESTGPILKGIQGFGSTGGNCTVFLHGKEFAPPFAGLLNATLGHSLDFDDTYALGTLHAGVTAIAAGLAQAEAMGEDSTDAGATRFLLAVAVGYEITCRLGRELANDAYERGFHNTGTAGIFGAVATIAVLKGLSAPVVETAFGLAGSKAAGSMQYLENGSWNKRLHPGFAVHDAFMCVALAEADVFGTSKSIEGKYGFLNAYSPKSDKDLEYLIADLGLRWTFLETSLKPYPACRMTHGLIEIAGQQGKLARSQSREVKSMTVPLSHNNYKVVGARTPNKLHPLNTVDAQFSAYFQLAHAWLYGSDSGVSCYGRLEDTNVYELSERITCVEDSRIIAMGCCLQIEYADGETQSIDIPYPLGEPQHPLSEEQIDRKFFSLASRAVGDHAAQEIRDCIMSLGQQSISRLLGLVSQRR